MKKEYKKFEAGFQEEVVDLLVLTSEGVGGAGLYAKGIWQASAQAVWSFPPAGSGREKAACIGFVRTVIKMAGFTI